MTVLLQQLPVLAGVVVGALASYLSAVAMERARWRRQLTTRWDTTRMEAYTGYAHAVKAVVQVSFGLCAARGLGSTAQRIPEDDGLPALAEAESRRGELWERVLLVGTPATIAAGRRWHECAWRIEWFARGLETGDDAWDTARADLAAARDAFYAAARLDLGVPGAPPARERPFAARTVVPPG